MSAAPAVFRTLGSLPRRRVWPWPGLRPAPPRSTYSLGGAGLQSCRRGPGKGEERPQQEARTGTALYLPHVRPATANTVTVPAGCRLPTASLSTRDLRDATCCPAPAAGAVPGRGAPRGRSASGRGLRVRRAVPTCPEHDGRRRRHGRSIIAAFDDLCWTASSSGWSF